MGNKMKQFTLLFLIILIGITAFAINEEKQIIENPKDPSSKDVGRIVQLKEIMRIEDDGEQLIFRGPYDLQIGTDGSIYFYDSWRLYKFDSEGKFIFGIIKQGQEPGEASLRTSYFLKSSNKDKIINSFQ